MPFPGFDIGSYPGDEAISAWAQAGLFKWCGYYLSAPCHSAETFVPFSGKAAFLHRLGLGLAIVYVGFQQEGCGSTQLTHAQGCRHGLDAVEKCRQEGFPENAIIFLDVEFFSGVISLDFTAYYQGWLSTLRKSPFQPGTYCAGANFTDVYAAAQSVHGLRPAIWIARESLSFDPIHQPPTDSGIPQANIWQGLLDTQQTQGGVTLTVDLNTADSPDPSQTRPTPLIDIIDVTITIDEEDEP